MQAAAAGRGQVSPPPTPTYNSSAPRPAPVILVIPSSSPFFFSSSPCSLHPPRLSPLFQTAAILPFFHLTLPRSSPRPVFIRVALTTHSSVGLIHHHHEERVRRVGTKTRGGGKVMHKSWESGPDRKLRGEANGEMIVEKEERMWEEGTEGEEGQAGAAPVSKRIVPQLQICSSFPAKAATRSVFFRTPMMAAKRDRRSGHGRATRHGGAGCPGNSQSPPNRPFLLTSE